MFGEIHLSMPLNASDEEEIKKALIKAYQKGFEDGADDMREKWLKAVTTAWEGGKK